MSTEDVNSEDMSRKPAIEESITKESMTKESIGSGVMAREEVLTAIRDVAERLGHPPSFAELIEQTLVRRRAIRKHFGSYKWALRECGLGIRHSAHWIPTDRLFGQWAAVARQLKKIPSIKEFEAVSKYTVGPYQRRFRHWSRVPEGMSEYAKARGLEVEWQDVMELIRERWEDGRAAHVVKWPLNNTRPQAIRSDRPVYGPAVVSGPLVHEPINEAGVLFLFGAMAASLGFKVTLVQTEFPDCEALLEVAPGRWQRIRIEFEYESRNFLKHAHRVEECDMIVCWNHNWPECPLEVLELRSVGQREFAADLRR